MVVGVPAGSRKNPVRYGSGTGPLYYGTDPVRDHHFSGNPPGVPGGSRRDRNNHILPLQIQNNIFTSMKHFYCGMIDLASGQFDMGGGRFLSLVNMITNGDKRLVPLCHFHHMLGYREVLFIHKRRG